MPFPSSELFTKSSENLKSIDKTLVQVELLHKRAIRENDLSAISSLRKIHFLLVGVRAESVLRKIVADPTGFNDRERHIIWSRRAQNEMWSEAVDLAVRRHYSIPIHKTIEEAASDQTVLNRIETIKALLEEDLYPVITGRNKIAHGQWVWQLKSRRDDSFLSDQMDIDLNYVAIKSRSDMLESIAKVVHILAVSKPTFNRDFAALNKRIDKSKQGLQGVGYGEFCATLRSKRYPG